MVISIGQRSERCADADIWRPRPQMLRPRPSTQESVDKRPHSRPHMPWMGWGAQMLRPRIGKHIAKPLSLMFKNVQLILFHSSNTKGVV